MFLFLLMLLIFLPTLGSITSPAEKKQMSSVSTSYDVLCAQVTKSEVSAEVLQKVVTLVDCLSNRNFPGASQIQAVSPLFFSLFVCVVVMARYRFSVVVVVVFFWCLQLFLMSISYISLILQDLANTVWNQHKDWIKGIKILIQLAAKK